MPLQIALLRGINLGGSKKVAMTDLRDWLAVLGFDKSRSVLQSGNLIFDARQPTGVALERLLEREAVARLRLDTSFIVRTASEWESAISANPFSAEARRDPAHLLVVFLKDTPVPGGVKALQAAIAGPEIVSAEGRQLYAVYPAGIGRSRLTLPLIEKKLGTRGTGRNWNTVLRLREIANGQW